MGNIDFTEALQRGLRPDRRMPVNVPFLTTCTNMRPSPYGLKDFNTVVQPITSTELSLVGVTPVWPWPQLFRGKGLSLLFDRIQVFSVTEAPVDDWQLTQLTTYDAADIGSSSPSTKAITTGGPWHFIDFYDTWMAFNGVSVVFQMGFSSTVWTTNAVTIATGADYKEARVFYAGFDPTDMYALADWPTFLDSLQGADLPSEFSAKTLSAGADSNWVWWSTIGGGDLLWLFSLTFMKYASLAAVPTTGFSDARYYFKWLWDRNECGLRPLPWQGTVYQMKQLGDAMMAYGTGGVSALVPSGGDPATFGLMNPTGWGTRLGIASRSAIGGSDRGHLVVDEAGELWGITPDLQAQRLGYAEWLAPLLGYEIVVSYEPTLDEYYISNGTTTYLYSESKGFCVAPYAPTTVSYADSTPVGMIEASASPTAVDITSDWFRGGGVGEVWTLNRLRLGTTDIDASGWSVAIEYRFKDSVAGTSSAAIHPDGRGVATFNLPGLEFRWHLTHDDKASCDLESVVAELSMDGKISTREWLNASAPGAATV